MCGCVDVWVCGCVGMGVGMCACVYFCSCAEGRLCYVHVYVHTCCMYIYM